MAQEIEVKIKVDTGTATSNVNSLGIAFDKTANDAKDAQDVFKKTGASVDVEQSIAGLKQLKRELKNTAAGSEEFKKIYNQIDDLEDKIKSSKNTSADFVDTLANSKGPLGALGQGLNQVKVATQSFGGALKATGIGLIVALIGGLVAAFSENEGAMKKLQPVIDGMKKAFQGVFRAVEPLFNTLVDLTVQALPYVTQGIGAVYSSLMAFFTLLKEGGGGAMKILEGIFTLDGDKISSGMNQVSGSFSKTADSYNSSMKRFNEGSKELTESEKEAAEKQKEIREKNAQDAKEKREKAIEAAKKANQEIYDADKKALEEKLSNDKLSFDERRKLVADDHLLNKEDRKKFNDEINKDEQKSIEAHNKAIEDLNKKYDIDKENREADTAVKKEELDYKRRTAEIDALAKTVEEKKILQAKLDAEHLVNKLDAVTKDNQALVDLKQRYADEAKQKEADTAVEKEQLDYEKRVAEIEKVTTDLNERHALIEELDKGHKERLLIATLSDVEAEKQAQIAKVQSRIAMLDQISSLVNSETDLGRGLILAKQALLVQELFINVKSLFNTATTSAQKATIKGAEAGADVASGVAKTSASLPFPANLPLIIGYAVQAVGIISAVKQAVSKVKGAEVPSVSTPSGGGGAGGGSIATIAAMNPSVNVVGASQNNQIADTIGRQGQQPIKAFVVANDVSTQQGLDRNIVKAATLG